MIVLPRTMMMTCKMRSNVEALRMPTIMQTAKERQQGVRNQRRTEMSMFYMCTFLITGLAYRLAKSRLSLFK